MATENVIASGPRAGSPSRREESDSARVRPDSLMAEVNRPRMGRMLAISTVFHIVLIGLTSVSYLTLAVKYRTVHPKWEVERLRKEKVANEEAAAQAKIAEEAKKRALDRGGAPKKGPGGKESAEPGTESRSGSDAEKKAGEKKSGVEKAVTETSKERPSSSSVDLELDR